MNRSQHFEAISAYRELQTGDNPESTLNDVAAYGGELRSLFSAAERQSLASPQQTIAEIFNRLTSARAETQSEQLAAGALSTLRALVDALVKQEVESRKLELEEPQQSDTEAEDG